MVDLLGTLIVLVMLAGPLLAWLRLVPAIVGFGLFAAGGIASVGVAILAIVRAARGRGLGRGGVAAIVVAAVFMMLASRGAGVPAINDFTTDVDDPPRFVHAATLPANAGRDLGYPPDFAKVQTECCADLRPAQLPIARDAALARTRAAAEAMPGWRVTASDPARGTVEAIATSRLFGFEDDIVIRVREDRGNESRVDMRSKSRDGRGDLGVNAARIRSFIATLEGAPAGK
jgi:uncharacterized protein (DUF1499 family)